MTWVGRGKRRKLNKRFLELRSWYLFESRFCNVAKGNEKGDVENLCKRSERTYLSPEPHIDGLDQLADKLFIHCQDDLQRQGPLAHHDRTVGELLAEEQPHLLPLQSDRFEACVRRSTFIDSHSLFLADTFRYSVPVCWAHHPCVAKIFVDRIEIFCQHERVAVHERRYRGGKFVLEPTHYLKLLERKPGSLDNAMAFKGQPWGEDFDLMRKELEYRYQDDGTLRYINILLLLTEYPEADVKEAVSRCVRARAFSDEAVLNGLRNHPLQARVKLDLSGQPELLSVSSGIRDAAIYDQLKHREEACA